jgi:hypothetical protein
MKRPVFVFLIDQYVKRKNILDHFISCIKMYSSFIYKRNIFSCVYCRPFICSVEPGINVTSYISVSVVRCCIFSVSEYACWNLYRIRELRPHAFILEAGVSKTFELCLDLRWPLPRKILGHDILSPAS